MFWRLHKAIFKDRIDEAKAILEFAYDTVQVVSGPVSSLLPLEQSALTQPALALTTLQDIRLKTKNTSAVPFSYYNDNRYKVSYWLPKAIKYKIPTFNERDSFWIPFGMLSTVSDKFPLFIKSDAGHKTITGQVINTVADILQIRNVNHDEMVFCAPARAIGPTEYRFWIAENRIVGCSSYKWDADKPANSDIPEEAYSIAIAAAQCRWTPDLAFVVDVAHDTTTNEYALLEYNCLTTSGIYDGVDLKQLFDALRQVATKEWDNEILYEEND